MDVFSKNLDGKFEEKAEIKFEGSEKEKELEKLIFDNPNIFPVNQISESNTWIPLARQISITNHGTLDILAVDADGTIYIVECKIKGNSDMKTIRGQITDYVAGLWENRDSWDSFLNQIQDKSNKELKEILKEVLDDDEIENTSETIKQNFEEGKYSLVYAVDQITPGLREVVNWHNSAVDVAHKYPSFALEMKKYSGNDNSEFITVQTFPYNLAEIKKKEEKERPVNTEDDWEKKFNSTDLIDSAQKSEIINFKNEIKSLIKNNGEISWGTGNVMPRMLPKFRSTYLRSAIGLQANGNLKLQFGLLNGEYPDECEKFIAKIFEIEEIKSVVENSKRWKSHVSDSTNWHKGDFTIEPKMWLPHKEKILEIMKEVFVGST